jgi:hypothetical protein
LVLAKSKERGFDEINNVIWASDLSLEDKASLDGKLEDRKSDVGQWQKSTPNGPQGLKREIPDIMLELKKKECTLVEDLVDSLAEIVESVLSGSEENIEIILIGGGVGSVLLNSHIRERLERDCIRITTSEGAVYSYVMIQFILSTQLTVRQMSTCPRRCRDNCRRSRKIEHNTDLL